MKKIFRILIITFMWILFPFLVYCGDTASEKPVIEITSIKDSISINNEEFREYDFTKLFKITEDGKEINVSLMYIDTSKVLEKDGIYPVYCIYNGVFKEISVLKIAVDVGFVVGITAATSPIGSAIFLIPYAGSSSITPQVFVSL